MPDIKIKNGVETVTSERGLTRSSVTLAQLQESQYFTIVRLAQQAGESGLTLWNMATAASAEDAHLLSTFIAQTKNVRAEDYQAVTQALTGSPHRRLEILNRGYYDYLYDKSKGGKLNHSIVQFHPSQSSSSSSFPAGQSSVRHRGPRNRGQGTVRRTATRVTTTATGGTAYTRSTSIQSYSGRTTNHNTNRNEIHFGSDSEEEEGATGGSCRCS